MRSRDINEIVIKIFIWSFMTTTIASSAERLPLQSYYIIGLGNKGQVVMRDFASGIETITDSLLTPDYVFGNGVEWQVYDYVNRRIFFQEAPFPYPFRTHICEIDSHRISDLPYDNYGTYGAMIISPQSEYVLYSYLPTPYDSSYSPNWNRTVVLDGASLRPLVDRSGLRIPDGTAKGMSFVTRDNRFLVNWEYLLGPDSGKEHVYTVFSLPGLDPLDTLYFSRIGWLRPKLPMDFSDDGLLFVSTKSDSSRNLPPGTYAFIVSAPGRRILSRFIAISSEGHYEARLTPEGDEIVAVYKEVGNVKRYSLASGRLVGETDVQPGAVFIFFGHDGNLYLRSGSQYIVVDYRHDRVVRTFSFERR